MLAKGAEEEEKGEEEGEATAIRDRWAGLRAGFAYRRRNRPFPQQAFSCSPPRYSIVHYVENRIDHSFAGVLGARNHLISFGDHDSSAPLNCFDAVMYHHPCTIIDLCNLHPALTLPPSLSLRIHFPFSCVCNALE